MRIPSATGLLPGLLIGLLGPAACASKPPTWGPGSTAARWDVGEAGGATAPSPAVAPVAGTGDPSPPAPASVDPASVAGKAPPSPPPSGAAAPSSGPTAPPPAGAPALPNRPGTVADLAAGGATTTLTVTLDGAPGARLDFLAENGHGQFVIVAQEEASTTEVQLTVPARYPGAITLFAWKDDAGNGPDPTDLIAITRPPLTFSGSPAQVTLRFARGVEPPSVAPPDAGRLDGAVSPGAAASPPAAPGSAPTAPP